MITKQFWPGKGKPQTMTPNQQRMVDLLTKCAEVNAFEYEGVKYLGYRIEAIKRFCAETTYPSDFHVWLQINYTQIP